MKKFTKISLIVVAVIAGVGIILCGIASLMGAGRSEIWRNGELHYGNWYIGENGISYQSDDDWEEDFDEIGETIEDTTTDIQSELNDELADLNTELSSFPETNVLKQDIALADVKNIKLNLDAAYLKVVPSSETETISAELVTGKEKYYSCILDGDTLIVKYDEDNHVKNSSPKIELALPEGASFEKITINTGAVEGEISLENITCKNLDVNVGAGDLQVERFVVTDKLELAIGAGNVEIKDGEYKDVKVECGVGNLELSGKVSGDITGHCGMGEMELNLKGKESNYNYKLSCGLGQIEINDTKYSNITGSKKIQNESAIGTIDLDCGMGSISVEIKE